MSGGKAFWGTVVLGGLMSLGDSCLGGTVVKGDTCWRKTCPGGHSSRGVAVPPPNVFTPPIFKKCTHSSHFFLQKPIKRVIKWSSSLPLGACSWSSDHLLSPHNWSFWVNFSPPRQTFFLFEEPFYKRRSGGIKQKETKRKGNIGWNDYALMSFDSWLPGWRPSAATLKLVPKILVMSKVPVHWWTKMMEDSTLRSSNNKFHENSALSYFPKKIKRWFHILFS